jgi:hypothetical protein
MKFALKLFCIGLLAAGFAVSGCDRLNEAGEEATAEETEEATDEQEEEEEADEEEEAADEEDEAADEEDEAADEGDAGADTGDEEAAADEDEDDGEEEAAADEDGDDKAAAKAAPKQPPFVGTAEGSVGGGGVTDGKLRITVNREYKANGVFTGKRGDKPFRVSFSGAVDKSSNSLSASGGKRGDKVRVSGKVTEDAIGGKVTGKVNGGNVTVRYTLKN